MRVLWLLMVFAVPRDSGGGRCPGFFGGCSGVSGGRACCCAGGESAVDAAGGRGGGGERRSARAEHAGGGGEVERLGADVAVLQRMLLGRSSERSRPQPSDSDSDSGGDGDGDEAGGGQQGSNSGGSGKKRGPGARAGRRDYSDLPRFEMFWDFPEGGYCCPRCAQPVTVLGDHVSGAHLDWQVVVRVLAHCRRRYQRGWSLL